MSLLTRSDVPQNTQDRSLQPPTANNPPRFIPIVIKEAVAVHNHTRRAIEIDVPAHGLVVVLVATPARKAERVAVPDAQADTRDARESGRGEAGACQEVRVVGGVVEGY